MDILFQEVFTEDQNGLMEVSNFLIPSWMARKLKQILSPLDSRSSHKLVFDGWIYCNEKASVLILKSSKRRILKLEYQKTRKKVFHSANFRQWLKVISKFIYVMSYYPILPVCGNIPKSDFWWFVLLETGGEILLLEIRNLKTILHVQQSI